MSMMAELEGVVACPLTAFDSAGGVDYDTYRLQLEFLLAAGASGVCLFMHAAESLVLDDEERTHMLQAAVDTVGARVPVLVHVSGTATSQSAHRASVAARLGADGIVCLPPYHVRLDDIAMVDHFAAVADATALPFLVYSYPGAGAAVTPNLLKRMVQEIPSIVGMKNAGGDVADMLEYVRIGREERARFAIFHGTEYVVPNRAMGGAGCFSITGLVIPTLLRRLWSALQEEDHGKALDLQLDISRVLNAVVPLYPSGIKAAAGLMGREVGPPRRPHRRLSGSELAELERALESIDAVSEESRGWGNAVQMMSPRPQPVTSEVAAKGLGAAQVKGTSHE